MFPRCESVRNVASQTDGVPRVECGENAHVLDWLESTTVIDAFDVKTAHSDIDAHDETKSDVVVVAAVPSSSSTTTTTRYSADDWHRRPVEMDDFLTRQLQAIAARDDDAPAVCEEGSQVLLTIHVSCSYYR